MLPDIVYGTPLWLALLTVAVGALEGALIGRASRSPRYDFVGAFIFAACLGLGGGIVRDLLLGNLPVVAIRTPWYLVTVAAVTLIAIATTRWLPALNSRTFIFLDALTLGLYTAIGTAYALDARVSVVGALFVGVVAGTSGGLVVALIRGRTPQLLVPGVLYAVLALAGAVLYVLLRDTSAAFASLGCVGLVVALRAVAVRYAVRTPPLPLLEDADRFVR